MSAPGKNNGASSCANLTYFAHGPKCGLGISTVDAELWHALIDNLVRLGAYQHGHDGHHGPSHGVANKP
eukprot:scaffold1654_cov340-Prasinococcus_capsulatus_cf.AAC.10